MKYFSSLTLLRGGLFIAAVSVSLTLCGQYRGGVGDGSYSASSMSAIAPLSLLDLYAKAQSGLVGVHWRTANEDATSQFNIERSEDGHHFTRIGTVDAAGYSPAGVELTYNFADQTPPTGKLYYRLLTVELDGSSEYSPVVTVTLTTRGAAVEIYPNPSDGKELHFRLPTTVSHRPLDVEIFDATGRHLVASRQVYPESDRAHIDLAHPLPPGSYLVRLAAARQALPAQLLIVTE
ncbi:MAG: T9SS type A sorting domain-containing protein [Lewinella sp.]